MVDVSVAHASTQTSACAAQDRRVTRFLFWSLFLIIGSYIFLSYWEYSRAYYLSPHDWTDLLAGKGAAPFQYRLGVLFPADAIGRMFPSRLPLRLTLTMMDFFFLVAGLAASFGLLAQTVLFRAARKQERFGMLALGLLLLTFYLLWTFWYHKPETIGIFFCLASSLWIAAGRSRLPHALAGVLLVVLAVYAATVRADTIFAFHLGIMAACFLPGGAAMPLGRTTQCLSSAMAIVGTLGTEYYIKAVLYPHAPYESGIFQLPHNLHPESLGVVLLALAPYGSTLWLAFRGWSALEGWERGLVIGSVVYFAIFFVVGRSNEVRIYLPFAMTLLVVSAPLLYRYFASEA